MSKIVREKEVDKVKGTSRCGWSNLPVEHAACDQVLYAPIQAINARLEALYNLANAAHLIKFDLKLVDFAQNGTKARDFGIGHLHCVTRAVVLHLGCGLGLLGQLQLSLV